MPLFDPKQFRQPLSLSGSFTGSFIGQFSGSINNAISSSYALSASYSATSSYATNFYISGSIQHVQHIDYDTGSLTFAHRPGRIHWDDVNGTLKIDQNATGVSLQVGQENYIRVRNSTGLTILNGAAVRISGSTGNRPNVVLAQAIESYNSADKNEIIGLATHDIPNNSDGYITTFGLVNELNTNNFNEGDLLYVSSSAGLLTNVRPIPPLDIIKVGYVVRKHVAQGVILVRIQNPIHLNDISPISSSIPSEGDLLTYNSSSRIWTNTTNLQGNYRMSGSFTGSFTGNSLDISGSAIIRNLLQVNTGGASSTVGIYGSDTSINSIGTILFSNNVARWRMAMVANRDFEIRRTDGSGNFTQLPSFRVSNSTGNVSINASNDTGDTLYVNGQIRTDRLGLGASASPSSRIVIPGSVTGATTAYSMYLYGSAANDVTQTAIGIRSNIGLATDTVTNNVIQFWATRGAYLSGASSTRTIGFWANNDLGTGGGVAYGFRGSINISGSNNWNLFMEGTAPNYLEGPLNIGIPSGERRFNFYNNLELTGNTITYANYTNGQIQTDSTVAANGYASQLGIIAGGSVSSLSHFTAVQGTFGAGSTVSQQTAYDTNDLTGGVINIAFRGRLSSGTGKWNLYNEGTAPNYVAGDLYIGTTTIASGRGLTIGRTLTGTTVASAFVNEPTVASDVTAQFYGQTQRVTLAANTVLANSINNFVRGAVIGSGASLALQQGYVVNSDFITAATNYGFRGLIPFGSNRWNLYMDGTANNYIAGRTLIGTTTDSGFQLDVRGSTSLGTGNSGNGRIAFTESTSSANYGLSFLGTGTGGAAQFSRMYQGDIFNLGAFETDGQSNLVITNNRAANTALTFGSLFVTRDGTETSTTGVTSLLYIGHRAAFNERFAPTTGDASHISLTINPAISQSAGATGATIGVNISPNITNAASWRSVQWDNNTGWGLYGLGTSPNYLRGNLMINTLTTSTFVLDAVGSGRFSGRIDVSGLLAGTETWGIGSISALELNKSYNDFNRAVFVRSVIGLSGSNVTSISKQFTSAYIVSASSYHVEINSYSADNPSIQSNASVGIFTGFNVDNITSTSITSSYAFRGRVNTGNGKWNLYMDGTADNFLAGKTGIGYNNPGIFYANKLVVQADGGVDDGITIYNTSSVGSNMLAFADGTTSNARYRGFVAYLHASDEMRLGTAGTAQAYLFSNGNFSLGNSTNAGYKLDVLGTVRFKAAASVGEYVMFSNLGDTGSLRLVANGEIYVGGANQCTTIYPSEANQLNNLGQLLNNNISDLTLTISNRRASSVPLQNGALFVTRNGIETSGTSGNTNLFIVGHKSGESFAPVAGTVTHTSILVRPAISQSVSASGITRGVYVAPILSSSANWRSVQWDNNAGWGLFGQGGAANYLSGSTTFGRGIIATYTPTGSTDSTLPTGSICADDSFLYRRDSTGTWKKIAWGAF